VPTEKRQRQKQGQQARKEAALLAAKKEQRKRRRILMAVFVLIAFVVAGLLSLTGDKDDKKDVKADGTTTTTVADGTTTTTVADGTSTTVASTTATSAPPDGVEPGGDTPVTELGIEDLKVGTGPEVKVGDTIVAHYYGATYEDGKKFQSSWDTGKTFETEIGTGKVIKGWDEGIPGMKVGGRRQLTIPAADAYGAEDTGDGRPHGDLVFIIDVYAVK
jgi:peptidylprolyl isomerase